MAETLGEIEYKKAYAEMELACKKAVAAAKTAFPIGAQVEWEHNGNGYTQRGEILSHGSLLWWSFSGFEILVRNSRTGKERRVSCNKLRLVG